MSNRKQWSVGSKRAGVKGVEEGMGLREATRLHNVPVETLRRRAIGNVHVDIDCKPGPNTVLTPDEEDRLVNYCNTMSDMGFGLSKEDVMCTAFTIARNFFKKEVKPLKKQVFIDPTSNGASIE